MPDLKRDLTDEELKILCLQAEEPTLDNIPALDGTLIVPRTVLSFAIKPGNLRILKKIYRSLNDHLPKFVDKTTNCETFIRILTSKDLGNEPGQINFLCTNTESAYILDRFSPLFENLQFSTIGKSKKIFSGRGRALTLKDLNDARRRAVRNHSYAQVEIERAFDQ